MFKSLPQTLITLLMCVLSCFTGRQVNIVMTVNSHLGAERLTVWELINA